jgi:U3 small nucleolar RNA-associated protein 21
VSYRTIADTDVVDVSLPSTQGAAEEEGEPCHGLLKPAAHLFAPAALEALKSLTIDADIPDVFTTPHQLDEELVTLTLLPRSRWQTLLNLDVIQAQLRLSYIARTSD